jgi:hypothetical protein
MIKKGGKNERVGVRMGLRELGSSSVEHPIRNKKKP